MSRSDKESRDAIQRNLESLSVSLKKKKKRWRNQYKPIITSHLWKQHEWLSKILRHIQVHFRRADIYQKSFALEQMLQLIVLLSQVTKIYDRQLLHLQLLPYNQHHYLTIGAINGLLLLFIRYQSVLAIFFGFQITVWCNRCLLMARQKQGHFHRLPGERKERPITCMYAALEFEKHAPDGSSRFQTGGGVCGGKGL